MQRATYDRQKAVQYAERWWNSYNPAYERFAVNCTNYVSQCLYAGGALMNYTGRRASGWWYRGGKNPQWSFSWSVSNSLLTYLATSKSHLQAELVPSPAQLTLGDVIIYDWDGDSRFQHSTIVTGIADDGLPLVNAQTTNSRMRYFAYTDSPAWTAKTQYRYFHIKS